MRDLSWLKWFFYPKWTYILGWTAAGALFTLVFSNTILLGDQAKLIIIAAAFLWGCWSRENQPDIQKHAAFCGYGWFMSGAAAGCVIAALVQRDSYACALLVIVAVIFAYSLFKERQKWELEKE